MSFDIFRPRLDVVADISQRSESTVHMLAVMRAERLASLIRLNAPSFLIAREMRMVSEGVAALFEKEQYDPDTDERVTRMEQP